MDRTIANGRLIDERPRVLATRPSWLSRARSGFNHEQYHGRVPTAEATLRFSVLGPLEVRHLDGAVVPLGGPKPRAILSMLILEAGRPVSVDRLVDAVWGDNPPASVSAALQVHVSNLRKVLGGNVLVTRPPGYALDVPAEHVDVNQFESAVLNASEMRRLGDLRAARSSLASALSLWRGSPLADVHEAPFATAAAAWLEERRALATDEFIDLSMALGEHQQVIGNLEAALARTPHREGLWAQLMLALYRSGRQADALAAYQRARVALRDDLGLEPGPELRLLESRIFAQDASLALAAAASPTANETPIRDLVEPPTIDARAGTIASAVLSFADGTTATVNRRITVIGRSSTADVTIDNPRVSREHAIVRWTPDGYEIADDRSTNGVEVNGVLIQAPHQLRDGDEVSLGGVGMTFRLPSA